MLVVYGDEESLRNAKKPFQQKLFCRIIRQQLTDDIFMSQISRNMVKKQKQRQRLVEVKIIL